MNFTDYSRLLKSENGIETKYYHIETFGCQQNEHDSEIIAGILESLGYHPAELKEADVIIFNTCAVRETAEDKVFGKIGALKPLKKAKKDIIIGIGGCMTAIKSSADMLYKKFPFISFVFGTNALSLLPEFIYKAKNGKRTPFMPDVATGIPEGLPQVRREAFKADISVMYGCDNFCSYCIVPYARGRERSREPDEIIKEVTKAVNMGAKEITLLGQNVNSYGKNLENPITFAELLRRICKIEGDFRVRFMTSHPKDASLELIDVIASEEKICKHLHLPLQSGSNKILTDMNRKYTTEKYLEIINYAKKKIPDLTVTSDIIVAFPGETEEDFEGTLKICEQIKFDLLFTFIYSPRTLTKAAEMKDKFIDEKTAHARFERLLALQNAISKEKNELLLGKTLKVLVTGASENDKTVTASRTEGNKLVHFKTGKDLKGSFALVKITGVKTWSLEGEIVSEEN